MKLCRRYFESHEASSTYSTVKERSFSILILHQTWAWIQVDRTLCSHTTQLVWQHCCKKSWKAMLLVLPSTFKPILQQIRLLQVAKSYCRKWTVVPLFATNSVHVAHSTCPRQTCFAASHLILVYSVTPALFYPIRRQYSRNLQQPDLLQNRFERGW